MKEALSDKNKIFSELSELLGPGIVFNEIETLQSNASDYTEDLYFEPDLVVIPKSVIEISLLLKYCNERKIPVTTRGAGTGLSGGALPVKKGVVLNTSRLNKILEIDKRNLQATVECGVINAVFREAVENEGLFYPPDPASKGSCFLGGNIAHNSGGPKALKYGVTKDFVLNLEVVLPNGDIIWTGANTLKNSTGYSLTQLMIGSEGTLAVVTKIVFKLLAKPQNTLLMLAAFDNTVAACASVSDIMASGVIPSALELMERKGMELSCAHLQLPFPSAGDFPAFLLIEVDGNQLDNLMLDCELINEILEKHEVKEVLFADDANTKSQWWRMRAAIGEVVKSHSIYKEEDTVVPRASLPELLSGVKQIGAHYGFESVCYGHAGDGNLHVNILKGDMSDEEWHGLHLEEGIREIFRLCKKLGGTISGEHGIGLVQQKYMNEVLEPAHFDLMHGIKRAFDPNGILNPGKIFTIQ
jgi:glycolate oxidase